MNKIDEWLLKLKNDKSLTIEDWFDLYESTRLKK